ncbi:MAG: hypothetical protein QW837_08295 [Conexivisphaerales archaeon]
MASLRIDNMKFATNLNFDNAEQMISAIPEEYRWGKDNVCKMGLRPSSRNFVVRVVYAGS